MTRYKTINSILTHFKTNWWKWILFILAIGISLSGYKCQIDDNTGFVKDPIKLKDMKK